MSDIAQPHPDSTFAQRFVHHSQPWETQQDPGEALQQSCSLRPRRGSLSLQGAIELAVVNATDPAQLARVRPNEDFHVWLIINIWMPMPKRLFYARIRECLGGPRALLGKAFQEGTYREVVARFERNTRPAEDYFENQYVRLSFVR